MSLTIVGYTFSSASVSGSFVNDIYRKLTSGNFFLDRQIDSESLYETKSPL